jgi:tetratricopeptide (TPR) repeat protein
MKKHLLWIIPVLLLTLSSPAPLRAETTADCIAKGNALANKKKYAEAIEQYQIAAKMDPKKSQATLLISLCYAQSGDLDKGLSYAERAVKDNPSYVSFYNLGLLHSARKEFDKAIEAFDRALKFNPKSSSAEYQKGLAYSILKQYDQAIPFYQKALKLNPSLDKVRLALFNAYLKQGDRNAALAQIEEFRKMKKTTIVQALEARMKGSNPVS